MKQITSQRELPIEFDLNSFIGELVEYSKYGGHQNTRLYTLFFAYVLGYSITYTRKAIKFINGVKVEQFTGKNLSVVSQAFALKNFLISKQTAPTKRDISLILDVCEKCADKIRKGGIIESCNHQLSRSLKGFWKARPAYKRYEMLIQAFNSSFFEKNGENVRAKDLIQFSLKQSVEQSAAKIPETLQFQNPVTPTLDDWYKYYKGDTWGFLRDKTAKNEGIVILRKLLEKNLFIDRHLSIGDFSDFSKEETLKNTVRFLECLSFNALARGWGEIGFLLDKAAELISEKPASNPFSVDEWLELAIKIANEKA